MSWKYDYLYYKNFFSLNEIKDINDFIENNYLEIEKKESGAMDPNNKFVKNTKTLLINYGNIKNKLKNIEDILHNLNEKNFSFLINPLRNNSTILLNIYDHKNKGEYGWHTDGSKSDIFDCKLTAIVNMSYKKYLGGKFYIFQGKEYEVPELNEPGTIVIFKSYLNHKVSKVLSGERRTMTIFLNGPKLK